MDTTINQISPVEYELDIHVSAEEIEPQLDKALRQQRAQTDMKGFRKGKVPMGMIKKMYGQAIGFSIAEDLVEEAFRQEVLQDGDYDVMGRPELRQLDYELDGDARGTIRFGVRPEFEIKDLSDEEVDVLDHEVTDEAVEEEIDNLRQSEADLVPLAEDEAVEDDHLIVFDIQELDAETSTPVIGKKDEDQQLFLDDERLETNPMTAELKKAAVGSKPGDSVRFTVTHDQAHGGHAGTHSHRFEITIKDAKRRELRELDDEFVDDVTDGQIETIDELRERIREELNSNWKEQARRFREGNLTERMLELHDIPVPRSAVEVFLDAFIDDVRHRNDGELPDDFDDTYFREQNRDEAERQARWMIIRDKVIDDAGLDVTDEDHQAFFEEQAAQQDEMSVERIESAYRQMPDFIEQLDQRLLSKKVYDELADRFRLVEKDVETIEREQEAQRGGQQEEAAPDAASEASSPIITG